MMKFVVDIKTRDSEAVNLSRAVKINATALCMGGEKIEGKVSIVDAALGKIMIVADHPPTSLIKEFTLEIESDDSSTRLVLPVTRPFKLKYEPVTEEYFEGSVKAQEGSAEVFVDTASDFMKELKSL